MKTITRQDFLSCWFSECEGEIEIRLLPGGTQRFFPIEDLDGMVVTGRQDSVTVSDDAVAVLKETT